MLKINYLAVIVAAIAAFVVGGLWYSPFLFGDLYLSLRGIDPAGAADAAPPLGEIIAEFLRCLVGAIVLAALIVMTRVPDWLSAIWLGILLWLGFQAMAIAGSVIHENYPWQLYAIHIGDALVKTILTVVILGVWRESNKSTLQESN